MKRSFILTLIAIGFILVARVESVPAQSTPNESRPMSATATSSTIVSGTIVSSSTTSLAIKSDAGTQLTFKLDGSTSLPGQMNPGDRIEVEYELLPGGPLHAMRVTTGAGDPAAPGEKSSGAVPVSAHDGKAGASSKMPHTASWLPLIALTGTISLGASLALRVARRARA